MRQLRSSSLDDGVEKVSNGDVVAEDLRLDAVDLALLFTDLFLKLSQLVLQRLHYFLGNFLLVFEGLVALDCLFAPVLVFFAHAVHIVRHEVDGLAERVGALAQDLDGFLHELNVVLVEGAGRARVHVSGSHAAELLGVGIASSSISSTSSCTSLLSLLPADPAHLDFGSTFLLRLLLGSLRIIVSHELLGFLYKSSVMASEVLHLAGSLSMVIILTIILHARAIVVLLTLTDQVLLVLSVSSTPFLLRPCLFRLHLLHSSTFAFLLFFADALALLVLSSALSLLLLLSLCFRFLGSPLCLSLLLFSRVSLSLCLGSGFRFSCVIFLRCLSLVFFRFVSTSSEHLRNMWSGINAGGGCPEHGLQESVRLLRFVACNNLGRLDIDLLPGDTLGELDQLDQEGDLRIFLRDGLCV